MLQQEYSKTTHELQQKNEALNAKFDELEQSLQIGQKSDRNYDDILNNGDRISDYSEDDLENENIERYGKYVPPPVKHIHANSHINVLENVPKKKPMHDTNDND